MDRGSERRPPVTSAPEYYRTEGAASQLPRIGAPLLM